MTKISRNSSIELARIFAMLLIIASHFLQQGRIITSVVPEDRFTLLCLSNGGRIAVNLFVLISCYFMVDKKPIIGTKWVRTYVQLFFYSATITTILLGLGLLEGRASGFEIVRCYLPLLGRPLWFVSAYLILLIAMPFLYEAEEKISKSTMRGFLLCLLAFLWINFSVGAITDKFNMNFMLDTLWFFVLYLGVAHIKHTTTWFKSANRWIWLIIGISLYFVLNIAHYSLYNYNIPPSISGLLNKLTSFCLGDIKSPINILIAFSLFTFFVRTEIKSNSIINMLAAPTLAIYIIHQHPLFYNFLWFEILDVNAWRGGPNTLLYSILLTFILYLALSIIEFIRRFLIDSWLLNTKPFTTVSNLIDKILGGK